MIAYNYPLIIVRNQADPNIYQFWVKISLHNTWKDD